MIENEVLKRLPQHLRQYIKPQEYDHYTDEDHAVWRYVMLKNMRFLSQHAHHSYRRGLEVTGITTNRIPNLYGMNRILKEIGWAAVAVDGFIPPRAFMEFQAYNVLVIASEIRKLEHIEYTPAPDIIHESAGHAPMLANPEYAAFLKRFGEIGAKAIGSPSNLKMFNAIRKLSILKESRDAKKATILKVEKEIMALQHADEVLSEIDQLRNLHWWSVEYGLIGNLKEFKLYGAGLLSSIGESTWCLAKKVKKLPFTMDVVNKKFDITKPQPQLFVTPDFCHLSTVLEAFAHGMGLRTGGKKSVEKLVNSQEVGTVELSTGIQVSGVFENVIPHAKNPLLVAYIQTTGATALAYRNQELIGHGSSVHNKGFGFPVGSLKGVPMPIEDMTPSDLEANGILEGNTTELTFESGVIVKGKIITGYRNVFGKIILISFEECIVKFKDQILFEPKWGQYDMAIGKLISSAYAGPADPHHFPFEKHSLMRTPLSSTSNSKDSLYSEIAKAKHEKKQHVQRIKSIGHRIESAAPTDWLLTLNFYELCHEKQNSTWKNRALNQLHQMKKDNPSLVHLIDDGLSLFSQSP